MNKLLATIFLLILVPVFGYLFYQSQFVVAPLNGLTNPNVNNPNQRPDDLDMVACTSEAKICFDGSGVGRVGPKCEFQKCPMEDQIFITEPFPYGLVTKELTVKGKAVGPWFFEGSMPVSLKTKTGVVIATGVATAQGDWMTTGFVPFAAVLKFDEPKEDSGFIVIEKSNPSGLEENSDEINIPVIFKEDIALY